MRIKNFHHVPQCYLNAFLLKEGIHAGKLRAINIKNRKEFYPTPANICAEKDYYLFDDPEAPEELRYAFETFLSQAIEPLYARIHQQKLLQGKALSWQDAQELAHFALWQYWQSPLARETADRSEVEIPWCSDDTAQRIRHIGTAIKNVEHTLSIGDYRIELWQTEVFAPLPTCDQPCGFWGVDARDSRLYMIEDFNDWERFKRNFHFGMPLTPHLYLFVFPGHALGGQTHVGLSQGEHWYNLLHKISHQARQFIIDPHPVREWK